MTQHKIKLLAFGMVAEKINQSKIEIDYIDNSDSLKAWIVTQYPQLKDLKYSIAINHKIVQANTAIPNGAEVALLPPFSGG
ncbi:MAG: MoaD/ThiS family protein [Bacteroidia bacterium]|nr:MoaD/ThiS family protein [Bacteroidia bacterium]MCO5254977.1 MoaD/ThiS family protein [Bacteroidota bacterium]MCZ2131260.1 MoaD/ThiS family protein [Bacteroidia bacterium]